MNERTDLEIKNFRNGGWNGWAFEKGCGGIEERIAKKEDGKEDCKDEGLRSDKKQKENERGIKKYVKKGKFEK